ncbi:MAG: ribosome maturation factor RimM [bacterium]|nr:ribosome maturation factor RimM [bacterium]
MSPDQNARIPVGYVRRAHGLRGDVIVRSLSDDAERFIVGAEFLTDHESPRDMTVSEVRAHADGVLLRFEQISNRNAADAMRGVTLTIGADQRRDLESDEYWPEDLEGLAVIDAAGTTLGAITSVIMGGAQDRLVVSTPDGRTVEVPFVAAIVTDVDIAEGRIRMDPPPGLFDD